MSYLKDHTVYTPTQREPLDERQVKNAAGGYVYELDVFDAAKRFLILGTEGGTFYQNERDLTKAGIDKVKEALKADGVRVVRMARDVSVEGRAAKNDMAIFVLALAMTHGDQSTKDEVKRVYNEVVRIGSHQLMFASFIDDMRGWGRSVMRVVGDWYLSKPDDAVAFQTVKYQNRHNWTHRDVLRSCHLSRNTATYRWIVGTETGSRIVTSTEEPPRKFDSVPVGDTSDNPRTYPDIIVAYEAAKELGNDETAKDKDIIKIIDDHGLTHEMVPNKFKNSAAVWEALLQKMPLHALIRNLAKMTSVGLFPQLSDNVKSVLDKLTPEAVKKARLHPITVLGAMRVYASGEGVLGKLTWSPNTRILSQLEDAFYWGFDTVEPSGKNLLLAIDTSGSMFMLDFSVGGAPMSAYPMLTCGEIAATLAMVTARVEDNFHICAFDDRFREMYITDKMALSEVTDMMNNLPHGPTDCALPMTEALSRGWHNVDGFCLYTDNETWYGNVHPKDALETYRDKTGRDARMAVSAMTGTDKSIADSSVPYMLDFVGISTDTPRLISQYIAGEI